MELKNGTVSLNYYLSKETGIDYVKLERMRGYAYFEVLGAFIEDMDKRNEEIEKVKEK